MMKLKRILLSCTLLLWLLPLTACATPFTGEPIEGQVLEETNHKPIAGAIVVGRWFGTVTHGIVESRTVCYHVESTTTDAQGRYRLPPTQKERKYLDGDHYTSIQAFKPGYERSNEYYQTKASLRHDDVLKIFSGTKGERLEQLSRFTGMQCGERENYVKQLIPLYKSIYEEAKSIAVTKEEKRSVNNRLRDLEEMELGYDKAWGNWRIREKALE